MKKVLGLFLAASLVFCGTFGVVASATAAEAISDLAPTGLSVSGDTLYITDGYTNQIYTYEDGELSLLAGNANLLYGIPEGGYIDGIAEYTLFDEPYAAVSWNGGVIVSDTQNNMLRFVSDGIVSTYAGTQAAGYTDGAASESAFYLPTGLAVDDEGNLYVADTGNGVIRKITQSGVVSTYATDFVSPTGLCWYDDALYVTDIETNVVLAVRDGVVSVIAGQGILQDEEWVAGYADGSAEEAMFSLPEAIYVDEMGIYIGDTGNNVVRKIADGEVTTLFTADDLADPTALVKYQGVLLIGDQFVRKTLSTTDDSSTSLGSSAAEILEEEVVDDSTLEINDAGTVEVEASSFNAMLWLGVLAVVLLLVAGAIGAVIYRRRIAEAEAEVGEN